MSFYALNTPLVVLGGSVILREEVLTRMEIGRETCCRSDCEVNSLALVNTTMKGISSLGSNYLIKAWRQIKALLFI